MVINWECGAEKLGVYGSYVFEQKEKNLSSLGY